MTSLGAIDGGAQHVARPVAAGILAALAMLAVYFGVLTVVSGWDFTVAEFARFWFYILALASAFGLQIGLYVDLKRRVAHHCTATVVTSGTTSTAAMVSCCAHYVSNLVPVIGAAGIATLIAQYQIELFWLGLAMNAAGIAHVASRLVRARRSL